MADGFDQFFAGIAQQESGGNYNAINAGSGAMGKYQIMPGNIPAWSKQYLGTAWSPQQFLKDPAKQDALARAVLSSYFDKYGARGAAAAWYSGDASLNMNYGSQRGGPSVGAYVDSVLGNASRAPGATLAPTFGSPPSVPATSVDATVPDAVRPPAQPGTSQMGAASAPGVEASTAAGVDAFSTDMAQAPREGTVSGTEAGTGTSTSPSPSAAPAGVADPSGEQHLAPDTVSGRRAVLAAFPGLTVGGFRTGPDAQDHGTGRAIDIMVPDAAKGQSVAAFAQAAAKSSNMGGWGQQVTYVIWNQHIWSQARASEGWRLMPDRGSPTANHMDHVHVSFQ